MFNPQILDQAIHAIYNVGAKPWFTNQRHQFDMHPLVHKILCGLKVRPKAWQTLLLEWPHVSETDAKRVAYTRSEEHGETNRQTVTSLGKYLARHWPHVPDHTRRNWVLSTNPDKMELWDAIEDIIAGVELGPRSCMQLGSGYFKARWNKSDYNQMLAWRADNTEDEPDWEDHPYAVYNPDYGWRMAVRITTDTEGKDSIDGRALVNTEQMAYVRSYCRPEDPSNSSYSDHTLECYLESLGYSKSSCWDEGLKLDYIKSCGDILMPYLDGNTDRVTEAYDRVLGKSVFKIDCEGEYECDNTNGTATRLEEEEEEDIGCCTDCGASIYDHGDYILVGSHEENLVCEHCSSEYTQAIGAGRRSSITYWVPDEDAVNVRGADYDINNLPSEIVELADRGYAHFEDAVCIQSEWYLQTDYDVIFVVEDDEEDGHAALRYTCWQDAGGKWHRNEVQSLVYKGANYTQEQYDELTAEAE